MGAFKRSHLREGAARAGAESSGPREREFRRLDEGGGMESRHHRDRAAEPEPPSKAAAFQGPQSEAELAAGKGERLASVAHAPGDGLGEKVVEEGAGDPRCERVRALA